MLERLKFAYSQIKIGDPLEPDTFYGPLHTKKSVDAFLSAIDEARKQGGTVLVGGKVEHFL